MSSLAAAGMFLPPSTPSTIPCPTCAAPIIPSPANTCPRCLLSGADNSARLPRLAAVVHCPSCRSYLHHPHTWTPAEPESKQLLSFLLRRLKPHLSRLHLVDAWFIFTEPHSKRVKLNLVLQTKANSYILQQCHVIEFTVHDRLCNSCSRGNTGISDWTAVVQLRQNVPHRRTLFYLEQLILRHSAAARATAVAESPNGIDFFFSSRSHAQGFIDFVSKLVPVRQKPPSDKLISQDFKSNTTTHKHTFSVEISPICREDLILLPPNASRTLGNIGPLVICTKVNHNIFLLDPLTLRSASLDSNQYWRTAFLPHLSSRQLTVYIVLDINIESAEVTVAGSTYAVATAEVVRLSDFGKNDTIFTVKTHLGHLLSPGDYALGYDLYGANSNVIDVEKYKGFVLPDSVLVRKTYEEKLEKRAVEDDEEILKLDELLGELDINDGWEENEEDTDAMLE